MTVDWLIASNNAGKSRDLQACLAYAGVTAQPYFNQFDRLTFPAETTTSYVDNAIAKARFGASQLGVPVIADDSGIEIPALPRQFGVTTARDLGVAVSGFDRNQEILQALRQVPDEQRQAVMRATLAAAWPDGRVVVVQGTVAGYLAHFQLGQYSGALTGCFGCHIMVGR